jgi:hypothetical protein
MLYNLNTIPTTYSSCRIVCSQYFPELSKSHRLLKRSNVSTLNINPNIPPVRLSSTQKHDFHPKSIMYLFKQALLLSLAALGTAFPSTSSLIDRQTAFTGVCILSSNTCNVTNPPDAAGIMLNCAEGGGVDGNIGEGQHNCTVNGHVSIQAFLSFFFHIVVLSGCTGRSAPSSIIE